jgi:hypothetical protein
MRGKELLEFWIWDMFWILMFEFGILKLRKEV